MPYNAMSTIFLPTILISIINIAIFYQPLNDLGGRLENLVVMVLAFVGIIGYIRQQTPEFPKVSLVEWLVYILVLSNLLCLAYSVHERGLYLSYEDTWRNGFFAVAVAAAGLVVLVVIALLLLHWRKWEPHYKGKRRSPRLENLDHTKWYN